MLIFPPFVFMGRGAGYSWIFSPPNSIAVINASQLIVQWVAVAIVGGIVFVLLGDESASDSTKIIPQAKQLTLKFLVPGLRVIRAIAIILAWWQVIGVFASLMTVFNLAADPNSDLGSPMAVVTVKAGAAVFFFILAAILQRLVSKAHFALFGAPYPAVSSWWKV